MANGANGGNADDFVNRKLIRPTRESTGAGAAAAPALEPVRTRPSAIKRPPVAPEQTHAENFYFQKQMQAQTLLTIVLKNGESIQGTIDWYDKYCIKLSRNGGRHGVLVYKSGIRYLHKSGE
jgi:host factor-I protein